MGLRRGGPKRCQRLWRLGSRPVGTTATVYRLLAVLEGRPPDGPGDDPARMLMLAARTDPDAARGFLDVFSCLALPAQVLQRPGMREKLTALAASAAPSFSPGPAREELIALTQ